MLHCKTISLDEKLDWDELIRFGQTATFFQIQQWMQIWVKHFPVEKEIIGVFDDDVLIGIAPFSYDQKTITLLGTTPVLGNEQVSDFGDIICLPKKEKDVWDAVLNYLSKKYAAKSFDLKYIRENSLSFNILKPLSKSFSSTTTSPYLNLPKSWEEYLVGLNRKNRHELRRKLRKLESINYRVYQADLNQNNQQQFLKLMKQSSSEKGKFLSKPMESFFSDFLTNLNKEQILLWFMEIEEKKVAAALAFTFKDELLLYNSGMDLDYGYLSVGLLSKALLIQKSIELGYKKFDFLQGDEQYKYNLGAVDNKLYQLTISL